MSYKPLSVGPWGGNGGSPWDDGAYTGITQIILVHGSAIDSIKIEYDKDGTAVWSEKHGGNGGLKTDKIQLDYPKEILTSFSGHYGRFFFGFPLVIRSLTFESNFKKYGPYGVEHGTYFSFPMAGEKIVGFHGRCGWYLDSIGVYLSHLYPPMQEMSPDLSIVPASPKELKPSDSIRSLNGNSSKKYDSSSEINIAPVAYGPWGGNGGSMFDDGIYTGVRQIQLTRGAGITSIKVEYDRNGQSIWGDRHGGTSGAIRTEKIVFDYPFEILTRITGYHGTIMCMGQTAVKSLTFHTTRGKYGPYGEEQGTIFDTKLAEEMIVGFHGRKGWALDAIGVHVLERQVSDRLYPAGRFIVDDVANFLFASRDWDSKNLQSSNRNSPFGGPGFEQVIHGVVREPVPLGPGPWGGDGGSPWDDGVFSGIRQIIIFRGEVIDSIQIEYDRNGQSVWSMKHGGSGVDTTNRIKFDYPNEVLTCVSGYYCPYRMDGDAKIIRSLTFHSSRGKYGPFGEEMGEFFSSAQSGEKIVGFHGRSGVFLDAIGVHMQDNAQKSSKSKISKFFSSSNFSGNK